ncbi:MAG: WS/DGAT domain-containing protein, partial [Oceanisphaera sp.]|nr:WS/DGAT domain-containing protein [Oceanisphaera sp.]
KTRFNQGVGPYRVFEAAEFPLDDIKMIKNVVDAKVNDVVLGIVSGAMRNYLKKHGELPEESLAAGIPLNMRTRRGVTDDNNQVGSVFMDLHTNIKNPLERIQAIQKSSGEAKQFGEASPLVDALKIAGVFSPVLTRPVVNMYINNHLSRHMPANISTVISNVAGPPFPLYTAGAKMIRYYGLGLLTPGMGLFHLAFSTDGLLTLSMLADRDIVPDPAVYRDCMYASFEELREAAIKQQAKKDKAAKAEPKSKAASAPKPAAKTAPRKGQASAKTAASKPASSASAASKATSTAKAKSGAAKPAAGAKASATAKKTQPARKAPVKKAKASKTAPAKETVNSLFAPV